MLDQADRLVENLLLARAQHGARDDQETIPLGPLLTSAIAARADLIASMSLDARHAADGTLVTGNPVLLAQMTGNLIDNAVRHNHPGGWIRAQITRAGPTVRLEVENGGPILDPGKVTTLAQPFRRLGTDRTGSAAGAGLGLSITDAIAAAHGGTLHLHAPPRRRPARGHRPARRNQHRTSSPAGHGRRRPVRVLVAEDVRRLADDIAEGLRDQGIAADVTYDGADATAKLDLNPYDVLILDRDLPGIHGDTICRTITAAGRPVMILMLTAAGTPGDRVTGLALGADDYLPKPFHFPELVLRIRALARRKPAARPRILRAAGIELDPLRRTVTRHRSQVDLSVKEFAVLETLMKAAPGALSAEDLLAHAWDENADPFTKTVQVTISRLRHKLGDPPPIQTIPGIGYRITDPDHQPSP